MLKVRLGVNIDHVATLRQARGESYPSIVDAATLALESGADQITIHLREDRRHIQDLDVPAVKLVTSNFNKPLNLEIGANDEIIQVALDVKPDWICLVPEKREEQTTEGGLNLNDVATFDKIYQTCNLLKEKLPLTKISLFVEAEKNILEKCKQIKIDAVEIHTGDYAKAFLDGNPIDGYIEKYKTGKLLLENTNINYHAGHGLTDSSLTPLVKSKLFEEYNIGHWIICDSVFCGMKESIKKLKNIIEG